MAYGNADSIAAFVPRFANKSGRFDNVTVPTLETVDEWRAQVSAMLDIAMATAGLPAPAMAATVVTMLDSFVNANVSGLVRGVNGQGRFAEKPTSTDEMLLAISDAADAWVQRRVAGIAAQSGITEDVATPGSTTGSRLPMRGLEYTHEPTRGGYA